MSALLLFAALLTSDPRLEALWNKGIEFSAFQSNVRARRNLWDSSAQAAQQLPQDLVARAKAIEGNWRLLLITVDRCSDSANSVPYIAALAKAANLELRIVSPEQAKWLQEEHRTPDGRAATPTLVVLNARFQDVGAWVERPAELQAWMTENRGRLSSDNLLDGELDWYRRDAGRSSLREIVELLEKIAARVQ